MRTIGVLGGIGPQATMDFEARLHAVSQRRIPQHLNEGYPPLVSVYMRHPPVRLDSNKRPVRPLELDPRLLKTATRLGQWADLIVMPCNTPHVFIDEIRRAAGCEVLSIVDVTVEELKRRAAWPMGLLGLGVPQVHAERYEAEGFEVLVAPPEKRDPLDDAIFAVIEGAVNESHCRVAADAVAFLRDAGSRATVLGCTEIPLLLGEAAGEADLINPAQLLAEAAVRRAVE